jgi:hypothetical protein
MRAVRESVLLTDSMNYLLLSVSSRGAVSCQRGCRSSWNSIAGLGLKDF